MSQHFSCLLFDLDGTLADTAKDLVATLYQLCDEENQERPEYSIARNTASHGSNGLIILAFGDVTDNVLHQNRINRFLDIYATRLSDETSLFTDIDTLLLEIESRLIPWGIVTNKPARFTDPVLKDLGILDRAACVVSADTTEKRKPHPMPMLYAAGLVGVEAEECLYIGDAERDIEAGTAAGMKTAIARWGYIEPAINTDKWNADMSFDTPQALLQWVKTHGRN